MSYNDKHNEANGEDNRDGESHNRSWNHGVEGPTDDIEVLALRSRAQRNFIATLLLSQGVPMLLHGDEMGRTQHGNNNTYAQDSEISWMHWDRVDRPLVEFTAAVSRLRAGHPTFRRKRFFTGNTVRTGDGERLNDIVWLHPDGRPMEDGDWHHAEAKAIGMYLNGHGIRGLDATGNPIVDDHFLLYFNAGHEDVVIVLPPDEYAAAWDVVIDTAGAALAQGGARPGGEADPARRAACWCSASTPSPTPSPTCRSRRRWWSHGRAPGRHRRRRTAKAATARSRSIGEVRASARKRGT